MPSAFKVIHIRDSRTDYLLFPLFNCALTSHFVPSRSQHSIPKVYYLCHLMLWRHGHLFSRHRVGWQMTCSLKFYEGADDGLTCERAHRKQRVVASQVTFQVWLSDRRLAVKQELVLIIVTTLAPAHAQVGHHHSLLSESTGSIVGRRPIRQPRKTLSSSLGTEPVKRSTTGGTCLKLLQSSSTAHSLRRAHFDGVLQQLTC